MRQFITMMEAYLTTLRSHDGDYEVFRNPSQKEFRDLIRDTSVGRARAVLDEVGDLLVWDAKLLHDLTPYHRRNIARLELHLDSNRGQGNLANRIVWRHAGRFPSYYAGTELSYKETAWLILNNVHLERIYGMYFQILDDENNSTISKSAFTIPPKRFRQY